MSDNKNSAQIINLQDLMSGEIGGEIEVKKPFVYEPEKKEDFFNLGGDEEEEEGSKGAGGGESQEEEEQEQEEEEKQAAEEVEVSHYLKSIKNLFGDSITHISQEDEKGEKIEVSLEEIEFTQELFEDIVRSKIEALTEEAKLNTVSTEGLSEFARELVEIDRMGGDVSILLQSKETYIDVLDKLNLKEVADQKRAIYLRLRADGKRSDEEIEILIGGYEAKGLLADKAEISDKEIRDAVNGQIEQAKTLAKKQKDERDNLIADYEKDILKSLDQFELADDIKKKVAKLSVKRDDKERFEIDNTYFKMKQDPDMAAKLMLFLLDMEEYNKQISKEVKKQTQLKGAKSLTIIKKKSDTDSARHTSKNSGASILLDDLNKK
jgi:hypothetical protein